MRRAACVLVVSMGILAGCDYRFTGSDRCDGLVTVGALHVVVRPVPGFVGWGPLVFVGDTLPLLADVRPAIGSSTDVWGGGGCTVDYGDPVPATIQWSSADPKIATVTSNGVVRGVAEGTVRVDARAQEQGIVGELDVAVWVRAGG